MGKIVASGGGMFETPDRVVLHRIKTLAGVRRPRILCMPTPGGDKQESWLLYQQHFQAIGCRPEVLWLLREKPTHAQVDRRIAAANIVFVGGGNTLMMMRRWKFLGVDKALRKAYRRGAVLCGGSAGAICWCDFGHSDSMRGYGHDPWSYIRVSGLGLIRGTFCPHYHHENRQADFHAMIRRLGGFGVACDDDAAIEVVDGQYRILAETPAAKAYTVVRHRGRIIETEIEKRHAYQPLTRLYART